MRNDYKFDYSLAKPNRFLEGDMDDDELPPTADTTITEGVVVGDGPFPRERFTPAEGDEMAKQKMERGAVKAFIAQHANLEAETLVDEARRLLPIAKKLGVTTTEGSLMQGIRVLKQNRPAAARPVGRPKATAAKTKPTDEISGIVAAIDDIAAKIEVVKTGVVNMALLLQTLEKENKDMRTRFDQAQKMFQSIQA
jgi:hypothetical protein